jgi:polysaccharide pyruvyl transferase WcaK-like protein
MEAETFESPLVKLSRAATHLLRRVRPYSRRALVIPPAKPGSLGDASMISATFTTLRRHGFATVDLAVSGDWPIDVKVDNILKGERFFYSRSDRRLARLLPQLASYSHVYFLGADVIDGAYNSGSATARLHLLREALGLGAKATVLGCSFNLPAHPASIAALRALPAEVRICARDEISYGRLHETLDRPIERTADVAFLLESTPEALTARKVAAWIKARREAGDRVLALNVNFLHERGLIGFTEAVTALLASLIGKGISIVLLPHDVRTERSDQTIMSEAQAGLTEDDRSKTFMLKAEGPGTVKAMLANVDLLITGRMHAAIMAMGGGTPSLCFTYQGKFEGLYALFGLDAKKLLLKPSDLVEGTEKVVDAAVVALPQVDEMRQLICSKMAGVVTMSAKNFADA